MVGCTQCNIEKAQGGRVMDRKMCKYEPEKEHNIECLDYCDYDGSCQKKEKKKTYAELQAENARIKKQLAEYKKKLKAFEDTPKNDIMVGE